MVLRQFVDTLGRIGIKRVPTVGSRSIPRMHEAIQQVETDEHPPGTVVAEVQPGYMPGRSAGARRHGRRRQALEARTATGRQGRRRTAQVEVVWDRGSAP